MVASLYLTSAEGRTGKSAIALGVLDAMLVDAPRVGVFRPLIRDRAERDRVLELLRSRATADIPYAECIGATYEEAHNDPDAAITRIVAAYRSLASRCDAVLVVGSDFTDVAVPTELAFNARIAANLDAPVLLILGGRMQNGPETLGQSLPRTAVDLAQVAELGLHELRAAHATVLAALVNRADPSALEAIVEEVSAVLPADTPVWALPEDLGLVAPSVSAVISELDGALIRGSQEMLGREVRRIVIAGMSMENVLPRLLEGSAVVIAADRAETLLAVVMAHEAPTFPSLAAVVLNGDFPLPPDVERLLDGIGSTLPIVRSALGTFDTAQRITQARGLLSAETPTRIDTVIGLFREHVDTALLRGRLQVHPGGVRTPIMFAYELFERAAASDARIVLPEGEDDRILRSAGILLARGTVRLTLLGDEESLRSRAARLGIELDGAEVVDPETSPLRERFIAEYARLRSHKGVTVEAAADQISDATVFGTMMVHLGLADGMVSGAAHTTAHTIRPALQIIRTKPGVSVVSSVFFMALADRVLVYGDCAVNPTPTAEQLADIAISSAETAEQFGVEPRVAMLSYSTGESGSGADVDKVRHATALARQARPDLLIEGPMQYDAAIDASVGASKLPGSKVAGRATVFIFPDLNTGNNTYKAVQRSAGAVAVGPVLQGLNKPVNDLSRGATVEDILNTVAITAVQKPSGRG
ncbi:phosphate acetyltransferase [Leucobacter weissii]|uniref:Phosphate acetyltransferase n=1 Tax=Leucobacter weissii TaxID=1983706 RepID=A0A939SAI8_9MICO|nr:phosphate acetyltransferase [Leucobacter weissii]